MVRPEDIIYMRRCIDLARRALGSTSPNPVVGAVVVHNGMIIGEGYHLRAGTPHAEVHALNAVTDKALLPHSTLYVSLEPCVHHGRTPPCTDLIISSGIRRVVTGTVDTSLKVAGKGIAILKEAGMDVVTGVAEEECRLINRRFFSWHEKGRPYIILKWARSADGFIDLVRKPGDSPEPHWITGKAERVLVHRWRAEEDAIMVGGATVRADNPSLDVRLWKGKNPLRVIASRSGKMNHTSKVLDGSTQKMIFTLNRRLKLPGAEIVQLKKDQNFICQILKVLHHLGVQSLLVEGGATIINSFVEAGLWDEARRFTGTVRFGKGVPDPFPGLKPEYTFRFDKSILDISHQNT